MEKECALFGGSLGTTPTSPCATGEREAGYLETECALFRGSLGTLPTSPRATARPLRLPWSFYHGAVSLPWWHAASVCEANHLKMALSPVDRSSAFGVLPRGTGGRKIIALQGVPQVTAPPRGSMTQLLLWIDRAEVAGAAARSHGLLACGSQVLELDALVCSRSAWQVGLAEFAATASVAGSGLALPQCVSGDAAVEAVTSVGSEGSCSIRNSSGSSSRRRNHSADLRFEHPLGGPPPRGQCRLDPLAGWLKAGDEPGFIAHARLALPSDWLLRTFRQQKRSIGKLRRSHFSGNAAVAGGLLLRAGRASG